MGQIRFAYLIEIGSDYIHLNWNKNLILTGLLSSIRQVAPPSLRAIRKDMMESHHHADATRRANVKYI